MQKLVESPPNATGLNLPVVAALGVSSFAAYAYFAFGAVRENTVPLLVVYSLVFAAYLLFIRLSKDSSLFAILFGCAVLFRAVFLFSEPNLSDDVYRFLWDGRLSAHGINPFAYTPAELMNGSLSLSYAPSPELFKLMNSPNYYTIYPPICQALFLLAGLIFPSNIFAGVVLIRLALFAAELRTMIVMGRILELEGKSTSLLFLYALNPLVILELTGNLHFEALMIMFLVESFWRWRTKRLYQAALFLGLAVATKLIPLILLPLFLRRLPFKQLVTFYSIVGSVTLVLLLPLLGTAFFNGISNSVSLYFQTFEFNASLYYIARAIGYWHIGWNMIAFNGKLMAALTFGFIMLYALLASRREKPLEPNVLFVWFIYLLFALTIHPWYVTPVIAFAALSRFRFPIVWSYFAFLTYSGYHEGGYQESLVLIAVEYGAVFAYCIVELIRKPKGNPHDAS